MASIIVTNDDGYDAPGILALAEAMGELGEAQVCAPDHQPERQRAQDYPLSETSPIPAKDHRWEKISRRSQSLDRPPIALRYRCLAWWTGSPDIVVSGINRGENMATRPDL